MRFRTIAPYPEMMNARTNPNSASASVNAMPRNIVVRTVPADSGWRAMAVIALPTTKTDADAGADGGAAVDDASTDRGQPLGGVGSCLGEEEMEQSHVGSPCCFCQCERDWTWSVRGVHRAVDVDSREDREDERLQEADQDLEAGHRDEQQRTRTA